MMISIRQLAKMYALKFRENPAHFPGFQGCGVGLDNKIAIRWNSEALEKLGISQDEMIRRVREVTGGYELDFTFIGPIQSL